MVEFDYDKIMRLKTVVHCTTQEEADTLFAWVKQSKN